MTVTASRLGFLLLSVGLILPRLFGGDSPATAASRDDMGGSEERADAKSSVRIRQAIRASFPYKPNAQPKNVEQSSPVLLPSQPVASDPDLVVLPQVEVRARPFDRGLPESIANWKDPRPQNSTRLGTGVREKDFGKVRAGVVTILYVPVLISFSW